MPRPFLGDELLGPIGLDPGYAAAGIGGPERAVPFRQNTLGPMQVIANVLNGGLVDFEIEDGIALHGTSRFWLAGGAPGVPARLTGETPVTPPYDIKRPRH